MLTTIIDYENDVMVNGGKYDNQGEFITKYNNTYIHLDGNIMLSNFVPSVITFHVFCQNN